MLKIKGLMLVVLVLFSCAEKSNTLENNRVPIESIRTFSSSEAHMEEPFLFSSKNGETYLSWIERGEKSNLFKYAKWDGSDWTQGNLIAEGDNWFVNWADYPQLAAFEDGTLIAFYLEKSGPGTFAYDIKITLSKNGLDWTEAFTLHDDATQKEHGFVSMSPWGNNMLITWLDGRNTGGGHDQHEPHSHKGQMNLRAAILDSNGNKIDEWLLDDRVCDCCQTSSTVTDKGPVVVFRDRSETEIRDIGIVRLDGEQWSQTEPVYMDLWEIAACPVNGPRIASLENIVATAWYSAALDIPTVKVAFSKDYGGSFEIPIRIDLGKTVGRVDLELLDKTTAVVSWMEEGRIMMRTVSIDKKLGNPITIASSSEKRSSGFPQISKDKDHIWIAWTDDSETFRKIETARIPLSDFY
jgi:hypothetical protein